MRRRRASQGRASGFAAAPLIALATLILASPAAATATDVPARISSPPPGARLVPGAAVAVEWAMADGAGSFDEMELLLSLDGGATYRLRVTREIPPGAQSLLWRVPQLPTGGARLALRVGSRGRGERVAAESADFSIDGEPREPAEELFRDGREWRPRDALERYAPRPTLPELEPPVSIHESPDAPAALDVSRSPVLEPLQSNPPGVAGRTVSHRKLPSRPVTTRPAGPLPLRE